MKNLTLLRKTILIFLLLQSTWASLLHAQEWIPQADSLFGAYWNVKALDAVDDNVAWAGLNYSFESTAPTLKPWIIRTIDGGDTWVYDTIPGTAGYILNTLTALNRDTAWVALGYVSDVAQRRLYRTNDGGTSWTLQLQDSIIGVILHFFDAQNGLIVDGNRYRHTSDGGSTWSMVDTFATGNGFPTTSFFLQENYDAVGDTIWVTMQQGLLARSTDKGKNWSVITTPLANDTLDVNFTPFDFADGENGLGIYTNYLFDSLGNYTGSDVQLFRTTDGGDTWSLQPSTGLFSSNLNEDWYPSILESVEGASNTYTLHYWGYYYETNESFNLTLVSKDAGSSWEILAQEPNIGASISDFSTPTRGWIAGSVGEPGSAVLAKWEGPLNTFWEGLPIKIVKDIETQPENRATTRSNTTTVRPHRNPYFKQLLTQRKAAGQ